ncbi:hypothetical protein Q4610_04440 [Sphingobium sp. HBC34]|uniref:Lipid A deacylase LpxR family protein n=1 Tax=Sphingobium cyanobacteriorum TaxID=3063954 RepID=A0ABT8ZIB3_9SPHN|nr:hypothetical protein [Sphingobium sp. HBC34]MDO7834287.1 hypothetical protein [Sphingobium sp. HBC34]
MTGAAHSRPLRFFALLMLGWIAIRLAGQDGAPPLPPPMLALPARPSLTRLLNPPVALAASAAPMPLKLAKRGPGRWAFPAHVRAAAAPPRLQTATTRQEVDTIVDMMAFIHFAMGFANRHYASDDDYMSGFQPTAAPVPILAPMRAKPDRWRVGSWLLWRPGGVTSGDAVTPGRLGGSQAGLRVDYELTPRAKSRTVAYGRITSALQHPAAPETAVGLAIQPIRTIPVSLAAERRIALGRGARNANAVMAVGGFGPSAIGHSIEAEGYAQAGIVGFRRGDRFIDGKVSLLSPIGQSPVRVGAALSGGAQPYVSRLDIGPELQLRLPLPQASARVSVEWRQRIAGNARPGSGIAITLATDF